LKYPVFDEFSEFFVRILENDFRRLLVLSNLIIFDVRPTFPRKSINAEGFEESFQACDLLFQLLQTKFI